MIDFVKALAWPTVVVIAFVLFAGSISHILQAVPDLLQHAESIDYGGFKMSLSKSTLPKPSEDVAAAISKMRKADVEELLSTPNNALMCDPDLQKYPDLAGKGNSTARLVSIGLADHEPKGKQSCGGNNVGYAELNDRGRVVKQFFISLISAQFQNTSQE